MSKLTQKCDLTGTEDQESGPRVTTANQQSPKPGQAAPHRGYVGGQWDKLGRLQFEYLVGRGLKPHHYLVDIACGSLRAGRFFIEYLEPGRYLGIEKEQWLIDAGLAHEVSADLIQSKQPKLVVSSKFEFERFSLGEGVSPDFAWAQSLFTHLTPDLIRLCLTNLRACLAPQGVFYATFFESKIAHKNPDQSHDKEGFWYTARQMKQFGALTGWRTEYIGDWGHPRGQKMLAFHPMKQGELPPRKAARKKRQRPLGIIRTIKAKLLHPLPNFIILGAQKAGTTSLYAYLVQHPQVVRAAEKELHFFTDHYRLGVPWYRHQFRNLIWTVGRKSLLGRNVLTGEATPSYLFHPHAPRRIAQLVPGVRLIAILRNPIARAYSHYRHNFKYNAEKLSFEEAIRCEPERIGRGQQKLMKNEHALSIGARHHSYLARGVYVDQIMAYHQHFKPEQMLILSSDELFGDPQATFSKTLQFLGVDDRPIKDATPRNVGSYDRGASIPMHEELEAYFRPHNRRLYDYLGRDFGWPADA